jgi:hypothetical protein
MMNGGGECPHFKPVSSTIFEFEILLDKPIQIQIEPVSKPNAE